MSFKKCFVILGLGALCVNAQAPLRQNASPVVMTVDGKDITAAEIQKILDLGQPDFMKLYKANPQAALMNWYVMLHLGHEGEQKKLDQTSPIKEILENNRMNLLAEAALNEEKNTYRVTPEMVQNYLAAHRAQYEESRIKAIYIAFKPAAAAPSTDTSAEGLQRAAQEALAANKAGRTESQAYELAADIVRQLRTGADFAKLAETYSDDPVSKGKGGDFGGIKANSPYPDDFRKAVLALEKGAISDPIHQSTGYYVVEVGEKGVPPFEQVRAEITDAIRQEHLTEFMQGLTGRFTPVIKDPSFFAPKQQSAAPSFTLPGRQ